MTDKYIKTENDDCLLEQHVDEDRRKFIKLALNCAIVYNLPLMTSFSMEGLNLGGDARADHAHSVSNMGICQNHDEDQFCELTVSNLEVDKKGNLKVTLYGKCLVNVKEDGEERGNKQFSLQADLKATVVCAKKDGKNTEYYFEEHIEECISVVDLDIGRDDLWGESFKYNLFLRPNASCEGLIKFKTAEYDNIYVEGSINDIIGPFSASL